MKKLFLTICALAVAVLTVTGCDDTRGGDCGGMIWDFANLTIYVSVVDGEGNDLLDPDFEGNILDNDISVTWGDKAYTLNDIETRFNMPHWDGLRVVEGEDGYLLAIGEFGPGYRDRDKVKLLYDWGDGTADTVEFEYWVAWEGCDPDVRRNIWLDGGEVDGAIMIVK